MLAFSTQLCCPSSLLYGSTLPISLCELCIQYMYTVRGGGVWVVGLKQVNNCSKVPLMVNFFR
jgi:hypothetical protein